MPQRTEVLRLRRRGCMAALIEIPLNSFIYRQRPSSTPQGTKTPAGVLLAHALHDVSGLPIAAVADATRLIQLIPAHLERFGT
ncbi:hypothetical protein JAO29_19915 [Edaphobacter sp. HDX4]|uniref:hypothetical protein n=1 Tax=Edaphobacter sp. HDX4 TaxID=2794064 RepID=UPI002FE56C2D